MVTVSLVENNAILANYIVDGKVDYEKLNNDDWLQKALEKIRIVSVKEKSLKEQFCFWLNAYNLLTLDSVRMELEKNPKWKGNKSYWAIFKFFVLRRHKVGNQKISLYSLENKMLRKKFKDPRIHFAINCASTSCPNLPDKLFVPDMIDQYLEDLTYNFINNQNAVRIEGNTLFLNRIFKWYKKDFKSAGGIISFVKKYWKGEEFPDNVKLQFEEYDWSINKVKISMISA